tara:strand:- start:1034 stop:1195 length:162 start_codon:yes stop_codon:yes gene_type:complete
MKLKENNFNDGLLNLLGDETFHRILNHKLTSAEKLLMNPDLINKKVKQTTNKN